MRSINRRSALIAAGSFGAGLIASTALGASWMREERQPTLTVLGCRNGLSALLTAGGARLLLLGGTDDADFGNALADARNPLLSRIDLVIVQGQTTPPPLVRSALRAVDAQRVYTIGSARKLLDAGIHVDRELTVPHQLDLPVETGVMIAPATGTPDSSHSFWSIRLQWRTHQVLIDSGGDVEALPSDVLHPTAWIRAAGAFTAKDILDVEPASLFIAAEEIDGTQMREILQTQVGRPVIGYRVHGGDTAKMQLRSDGLHLPGNPASDPAGE